MIAAGADVLVAGSAVYGQRDYRGDPGAPGSGLGRHSYREAALRNVVHLLAMQVPFAKYEGIGNDFVVVDSSA